VLEGGDHDLELTVSVEISDRGCARDSDAVAVRALVGERHIEEEGTGVRENDQVTAARDE
jgi:hypothetical protein